MKKIFPYEKEAFSHLIKLENKDISPSDISDWAAKKLESTAYDDALADICLYANSQPEKLINRLKDLISDYPKMYLEYEAIETSQAIIDDKIHFVYGCRKLARIVRDLGLDSHPKYLLFCAVDSEADGFPLTNERLRALWNKDALKKNDEEYERKVAGYLPDVKQVCRILINEIEPGHGPYAE